MAGELLGSHETPVAAVELVTVSVAGTLRDRTYVPKFATDFPASKGILVAT